MSQEFMDNDGTTHEVYLKPCPFCGEQPDISSTGNSHTKSRKVQVSCKNTKCMNKGFVVGAIKHGFEFCVEHAVKRWNNRAI